MSRLWPSPAVDIDPLPMYSGQDRPAPAGRPYVMVNMVSTVDGATALDGVTKALGSPTDRAIFHHLREVTDAILVGAETIRAERYGPARPSPEGRARRQQRGQTPTPPIVVVSRSIDLDWETPFFAAAESRPVLLVPADADAARLAPARRRADVLAAGEGGVDLGAGLEELRARGVELLLCEGGPSLNSQMLQAGLVDELCLTVAPTVTGGSKPRGIFSGRGDGPDSAVTLGHILEEDNFLYLRYHVAPSAS